ncbi:hypothetical protein DFQ30_009509 [Apophysomyces sp. BC1015]|nr:hypothetical protein DFQ30_009509 [Apophysomyces sp. BC1015]
MCLFSTAKFEVLIGFTHVAGQPHRLCPDVLTSCPVTQGNNVTLGMAVPLPEITLPLADIIGRYSAWTADQGSLTCVSLAPVGYQNPTWKFIFIFLPVGFTLFAALISFLASFASLTDVRRDILLFTSNYAMLPAALRLKTPGFFDLIYHAQFIVMTGQLSLPYPVFYRLFASNFAWSFLLFPTRWLNNALVAIHMPPSSLPSNASVADDERAINVTGTGMANLTMPIGLDINDLFLTCLIFFLFVFSLCIFMCCVLWIVMLCLHRAKPDRFNADKMKDFSLGIALRVVMLFYLPLVTTAFYQLMLRARWYILTLAAIVLVFPLFLLPGYIAFVLLGIRPPSVIYSDTALLLRYGSLYNTFTDDKFYFFIVIVVYKLIVGAMAGLFQANSIGQLVVIILAEAVFLVTHIMKQPHCDQHINHQYSVFGAIRLIIVLLNLAYLDVFHTLDRDKQCIAYTQVALHCLVFLLMFALPVKNLVVLMTGLGDDELHGSSRPPASMAVWRRQYRPTGMEPDDTGEMSPRHGRSSGNITERSSRAGSPIPPPHGPLYSSPGSSRDNFRASRSTTMLVYTNDDITVAEPLMNNEQRASNHVVQPATAPEVEYMAPNAYSPVSPAAK